MRPPCPNREVVLFPNTGFRLDAASPNRDQPGFRVPLRHAIRPHHRKEKGEIILARRRKSKGGKEQGLQAKTSEPANDSCERESPGANSAVAHRMSEPTI